MHDNQFVLARYNVTMAEKQHSLLVTKILLLLKRMDISILIGKPAVK